MCILEALSCMGIYILFFLIDDIAVFVIAMTTLKVTGISTKYSKYSHLIAGIITLIIGLLLERIKQIINILTMIEIYAF